jgi:putative ABC transport system permease protein
VVSLLVGAMVIANAFSITAAQRTRENALLRALGARRGQVTRSVVIEALFTGLVASTIGVLLGIGTARALQSLVETIGVPLPDGPLAVNGRVFVVGLVVGTAVTVLAAYLPARRSGRTAPVSAMRDAGPGAAPRLWRRGIIGTVLAAIGGVAIASGLAADSPSKVGLGSAAAFVALVVLGPVLAPGVVRMLGAPLKGTTGVLARQNARRNPRRTAATASSLMVGLGLISFLLVLGTSARTSFASLVDNALRGQWMVSTVFGQGGVSGDVAREIDALPETGAVSPLRYTVAEIKGEPADVSASNTAVVDKVLDSDVQHGSLADVGAGDIAVRSDFAEDNSWHVGDTVNVGFPETGDRQLTIRAIYDTQDPLGPYTVAMSTFRANVSEDVDRYVFATNAPGVSDDQVRAAINKVLASYPTAELQTGDEFAEEASAGIGQMINLMFALLGLAVVIALFGIMNTLALSVHERTRELGLLRAVGMDRRQVRTTVRLEAVMVSLFGTLTGLVAGTGIAVALVRSMRDMDFVVDIPVIPLLAVLAVGAVAGVVCAVLPARRAAKVDLLRALYAD